MKTLVIHPDDRSTDFLKKIYEGKDWTIVNDYYICRSRKDIADLIKKHDRIVMMGHGTPYGLLYSCINSDMVYLLRQKECVCIWCNADQFVEKYGLRGFYTGMFISEVSEANHFGIITEQNKIDYSNDLFALIMRVEIDAPNTIEQVKKLYASNTSTGNCPVIKFNNERLYYRNDDDTMKQESQLAERDLEEEMRDWTDDLSEEEQPSMGEMVNDLLHEHYMDMVNDFMDEFDEDDVDPAGGHGLNSHI